MEPINPVEIAKLLEAEDISSNISKIREHFSKEAPYKPEKISNKALVSSFIRGYEIRLAVKNSQKNSLPKHDPFNQKKTRKPYIKIPIHLPNLDTLLNNAPLVPRDKIRSRHLNIIRDFLLDNISQEELCVKYGLSRSAIHNIVNSPIAKDIISKDLDGLINEYKTLGHTAVENIRTLLKSSNNDIKLKATELYMKRANFLPSQELLHKHIGAGDNGEIIHDFKRNLLKKAGVDNDIIEASFSEVPNES